MQSHHWHWVIGWGSAEGGSLALGCQLSQKSLLCPSGQSLRAAEAAPWLLPVENSCSWSSVSK